MNILRNKKGQGSALSGDLPAIIMIVVSLAFFISALGFSFMQFNDSKDQVSMRQAITDVSTAFMKSNARLTTNDLCGGGDGFFETQIKGFTSSYGVNIYAEIESIDDDWSFPVEGCQSTPEPEGTSGRQNSQKKLIRKFPIAIHVSDLEVHQGIIRVTIWK